VNKYIDRKINHAEPEYILSPKFMTFYRPCWCQD